jgi:hypothetical protein
VSEPAAATFVAIRMFGKTTISSAIVRVGLQTPAIVIKASKPDRIGDRDVRVELRRFMMVPWAMAC